MIMIIQVSDRLSGGKIRGNFKLGSESWLRLELTRDFATASGTVLRS